MYRTRCRFEKVILNTECCYWSFDAAVKASIQRPSRCLGAEGTIDFEVCQLKIDVIQILAKSLSDIARDFWLSMSS